MVLGCRRVIAPVSRRICSSFTMKTPRRISIVPGTRNREITRVTNDRPTPSTPASCTWVSADCEPRVLLIGAWSRFAALYVIVSVALQGAVLNTWESRHSE